MARQRLVGFVSYARIDTALVERFLALMAPRSASLRALELDAWWDRRLPVGEPWEQRLLAAIEEADFGLFCMTPSFLASDYVRRVELPRLLANGRVTFPVGLECVDLARADLRGLDRLQIFRYRPPGTKEDRWFADCAGPNRARFCDELVGQMVDRLTQTH